MASEEVVGLPSGSAGRQHAADGDMGQEGSRPLVGLQQRRLEEPGLGPSGEETAGAQSECQASCRRAGVASALASGRLTSGVGAVGKIGREQKGGGFLIRQFPVVGGNPQHLKPKPTFLGSVPTLRHDQWKNEGFWNVPEYTGHRLGVPSVHVHSDRCFSYPQVKFCSLKDQRSSQHTG